LINAAKPEAPNAIPQSLRWLAEQTSPLIFTPPTGAEILEPKHTVPLNDIFPAEPWRDGSDSRARLAKFRRDKRLEILGDRTIRYVWKDISEPPAGILEELDALMAKVPYLGISEDSGYGMAALTPRAESRHHETELWVPGLGFGTQLASFDADTLDRLVLFHHSGKRQVARLSEIRPPVVSYRRQNDPAGLFEVFRFEDEKGRFASFDLRDCCFVAEEVRKSLLAAMKATGVESPFLHGHHEQGRDHIQILPLPSIGHEHTDGRLRRVALVGTPTEAEVEDVRMVLNELAHSRLGSGATISPEYIRSGVVSSILGETTDFVTITPVVLPNPELRGRHGDLWRNRHDLPPDEKNRIELLRKQGQQRLVQRLLKQAGLQVLDVAIQNSSFARQVPSASDFKVSQPRKTYMSNSRVHLRIRLASPVASPLSLGPGRFFGMGTLVPYRALKGETQLP
jgi:CRISPR-associated protein Csb2